MLREEKKSMLWHAEVSAYSQLGFIHFLMDMNNFTEREHQKGHWMHKMDQNKNCVISLKSDRSEHYPSHKLTHPFPFCSHMWVLFSLLLRSWCLYLLCLPSGREAWKSFSTEYLFLKVSNLGQSFASLSLPVLRAHNRTGACLPEQKYPFNRPQGESSFMGIYLPNGHSDA